MGVGRRHFLDEVVLVLGHFERTGSVDLHRGPVSALTLVALVKAGHDDHRVVGAQVGRRFQRRPAQAHPACTAEIRGRGFDLEGYRQGLTRLQVHFLRHDVWEGNQIHQLGGPRLVPVAEDLLAAQVKAGIGAGLKLNDVVPGGGR